MKLTLHRSGTVIQIDLHPDQFGRLRDPEITEREVSSIAAECGVAADLLLSYVEEIRKPADSAVEMDASCDYTDHFS